MSHFRQKSAVTQSNKRMVQVATKLDHKDGYVKVEKEDHRSLIADTLKEKALI